MARRRELSVREQVVKNQDIIDELNEKLARKTQEVRIIQEISSEINSTLELDQILDIILESMSGVLEFKNSMILLLDKKTQKLVVSAKIGYEDGALGAEVAVGEGYIGVVARRKKIMRVGNIQASMTYASAILKRMKETSAVEGERLLKRLPGLENVQSQIGIPLLLNEELIGVFAVESTTPNAFDELDEVLLTILANQTASAVNNAYQFRGAKERVAELNQANKDLSRLKSDLERKVEERTERVSRVLAQVQIEKQRSEDLLNRMAPAQVIPLMLRGKLKAKKLFSTIMFADLEGFTQYSSLLEPDELFSELNSFLGRAGEQIRKHHGYVNKTIGDGIMALFGVPRENKTHALDGILAALSILEEVKTHSKLNMRIGINSGNITAGMLGPQKRSLYDVLGDSVNLANRLEQISPSGCIVISSDTHSLVKRYFDFEDLHDREVKGKGAVHCYQVLGVKQFMLDETRVDRTNAFYGSYLEAAEVIAEFKNRELEAIDFISIQAHDGAIMHNEATATYSLALCRYLRDKVRNDESFAALRPGMEDLSEEDIILTALLHDVGKHAIDTDILNAANLSAQSLEELRTDVLRETSAVLMELNYEKYITPLENLYYFKKNLQPKDEDDLLTIIVSAANLYDTLTAPKLYKGEPWTITGSLEELLRIPYCQSKNCQVYRSFVELFKPESMVLRETKSSTLFE